MLPWFKKKETSKPAVQTQSEKSAGPAGQISFDDFTKVDLRAGKILEASRVEGSPKLLKLKVDFGSEQRQILAGIGKAYEPETLIGKIAAFVFNLAPRKIMNMESQGMILAASDESSLAILTAEREIKPGSKLS